MTVYVANESCWTSAGGVDYDLRKGVTKVSGTSALYLAHPDLFDVSVDDAAYDDVLFYANLAAFPLVGSAGILYIAEDTKISYEWTGAAYTALGAAALALGETSGTAYRGDRGKTAYDHSQAAVVDTINFVIDGGGSAIATGVKGDVEVGFNCTINSWTLLADQTGDIVVNLWKQVYASYPPTVTQKITASAPPTISSGVKAQNATLTGWTKTISAGDVIRYNVDSAATVTRVSVVLEVTRT